MESRHAWRMQFDVELLSQVCLDEWTPDSGHGELLMPGEADACPVPAEHVNAKTPECPIIW